MDFEQHTVGELKAVLADLPDEMKIVMSRDAEGNGHSPIASAEEGMYLAENAWSGEVYVTSEWLDEKINAESDRGGWSEEDRAPEGAERVLVLWPVN